MEIMTADYRHGNVVVDFFQQHLNAANDGIYGPELLCPDGARAATRKNEVIIAVADTKIVGAYRFYKRKTTNIVSLYQFAITGSYRGQGLLGKMLQVLDTEIIEVSCGVNSQFNHYYVKTGWELYKSDERFNRWHLKPVKQS